MATERSATRRGLSRRSRGVIRRFTEADSIGVVAWLTISGGPPEIGLGSVGPTPAPTPAVATEARTLPAAAMGWPWSDATSSSQLWKRSAGSFISIRLISSKSRRSSAVISWGTGTGSVMCL